MPRNVTPSRKRNLNFKVRPELLDRLTASAEERGVVLSEEVERILEAHFSAADLRTILREELEVDRVKRQLETVSLPWSSWMSGRPSGPITDCQELYQNATSRQNDLKSQA